MAGSELPVPLCSRHYKVSRYSSFFYLFFRSTRSTLLHVLSFLSVLCVLPNQITANSLIVPTFCNGGGYLACVVTCTCPLGYYRDTYSTTDGISPGCHVNGIWLAWACCARCLPCQPGYATVTQVLDAGEVVYRLFNPATSQFSGDLSGYNPIVNFFGAFDNTYCAACPIGTYSGQSEVETWYSEHECKLCEPGKISSGTASAQCTACAAGKYQAASGQSQCSDCPSGKDSASGSSACYDCQAGKYKSASNNGVCTNCNANSYQPSVGQSYCHYCPSGKSSPVGSRALSDCTLCQVGFVPGGSGCTACEIGKYYERTDCADETCGSEQYYRYNCWPCSPYSNTYNSQEYQDVPGSTSCKVCPSGHYTTGETYWTNGITRFLDRGPTACTVCTAGKHASTGGKSAEICQTCSQGSYCINGRSSWCSYGHYADLPGRTACTKCGPGWTTSIVGRTSSSYCEKCPSGKFEQDGYCYLCPSGKYMDASGYHFCAWCLGSSYATSSGSTACEECPNGHYTSQPTAADTGNTACTPCDAGKYVDGQSTSEADCIECPPGFYCTGTGLDPTSCPAGQNAASGSSDVSDCWMCPAGTTRPLGSQSGCEDCIVGKYSDGTAGCVNCAHGTYMNSVGSSYCNLCAYDMYTDSVGADDVSDCQTCSVALDEVVSDEVSGCTKCDNQANGLVVAVDTGSALECQYCSELDEYKTSTKQCQNCPAGNFLLKHYSPVTGTLSSTEWDTLWSSGSSNIQATYSTSDTTDNKLELNLASAGCYACRPPYYCGQSSTQTNAYVLWSSFVDALDINVKGSYLGLECGFDQVILIKGATSSDDCVSTPSKLRVMNRMTVNEVLGGLESYYVCEAGYGIGSLSNLLTATTLPSEDDAEYPRCLQCDSGLTNPTYSTSEDGNPCSSCTDAKTCDGVTILGTPVADWKASTVLYPPVRYDCGGASAGQCGCPGGSEFREYIEVGYCFKCNFDKFQSQARAEANNGLLECASCDSATSNNRGSGTGKTQCSCKDHAFNVVNSEDVNEIGKCRECPGGQQGGGGTCVDCEVGKKRAAGEPRCTDCPPHQEASSDKTGCVACGVGKQFSDSSKTCEDCPAFSRRNDIMISNDVHECESCAVQGCPVETPILTSCDAVSGALNCEACSCSSGTYCATPNDPDTCTDCPALSCVAGQTDLPCGGINSGECVDCLEGTFNIDGGVCNECSPCPAMTTLQTRCQKNANSVCAACGVGLWSDTANTYADHELCQQCASPTPTHADNFQFNPCCEYNDAASKWWCGTSGTTNEFLAYDPAYTLLLDTTDTISAPWDCSSRCNKYPYSSESPDSFYNCPIDLRVKVNSDDSPGTGRLVSFFKTSNTGDCHPCERRWSIGTPIVYQVGDVFYSITQCDLGQVLQGCGGSTSTSAGQCVSCASGQYHDACRNLCVDLTAQHRVIEQHVLEVPPGYSCTSTHTTEFEEDCGEYAISWDSGFDAGSTSSDSLCHCSEGNFNDATGLCVQCANNKYGVVIPPTTSNPRTTRCDDCPVNSGHNQWGQTEQGCLCNAGFQDQDDPQQLDACIACPVGKFKTQRSTSVPLDPDNICKPCAAGSYQNLKGQSSCNDCPKGFYCPYASANPIVCPDFKTTSTISAQRPEDCICDESISTIIDGSCVTQDTFCQAGYYARQQTCVETCEDLTATEADTEDCAATALGHAEALAVSHGTNTDTGITYTPEEIWLQEALVRVAWMAGNKVNLEVMPYPTNTDAEVPNDRRQRIAVIYQKTFYDTLCNTQDSSNNLQLQLMHTFVLNKEWVEECSDENSWSQNGCPHIEYQTISSEYLFATQTPIAFEPHSDFAYILCNEVGAAENFDYRYDQISMQWTTALLQCMDYFHNAETNPIYKHNWLDSDDDDDQWNPSASWPGRHTHIQELASDVEELSYYTTVLLVGGYTDVSDPSASGTLSGHSVDSMAVVGCMCYEDETRCAVFCRQEIEYEGGTGNTKYINAVRFIRTPPRQTLPHQRAPGLRGAGAGEHPGKFFDRRPMEVSIIPDQEEPCSVQAINGLTFDPPNGVEYEGNVLCFHTDGFETGIVHFHGTCGQNSGSEQSCFDNIDRCLRQAHSILLPSPYQSSESHTQYDTTVLHMPYSSSAHTDNILSTFNGAVFDFVPIYGYILEVRSGDCGIDEIQKRVYLPLSSSKANVLSKFTDSCETPDTAGAYSAQIDSRISTAYAFLSVYGVYWADLPLDTTQTFVRMRTWTAYGYSAPSLWQPLLVLTRICEQCPVNSNSDINSQGVGDCLCKPGFTSSEESGKRICAQCVSGKYKSTDGNEPCTNCDPVDNQYYISPLGSTSVEACESTDPTETEFSFTNFNDGTVDIQPIVVCVDWKTARERSMATEEYPYGFLIEYECVTINPCPATGDNIQPNTWYHRSISALKLSHEQHLIDNGDIFNQYNIEYARIPAGVVISTAVPNFAHYKDTGMWEPDMSTVRTVAGTCIQDSSRLASMCAQDIRSLFDYSITDHTSSYTTGTTQMIKFSIASDHTCNHVADSGYMLDKIKLADGATLEVMPFPRIVCVPEQTHGHFETDEANECTLVCDTGYSETLGICERTCPELRHPHTSCTGFQKAADVCDADDISYFECVSCEHVAQHESGVFDSTNPTTCQLSLCANGYTTPIANGECVPCPVHTKQENNQCVPCQVGAFYQPDIGQIDCQPCPWKVDDLSGATCNAGFYAEAEFNNIQAYLASHAEILPDTDLQKHTWCAQGYACLPCVPGTFSAAADACQACALGTYQNGYGQTACFDCAEAGQATLETSSTRSTDCVCDVGFGAAVCEEGFVVSPDGSACERITIYTIYTNDGGVAEQTFSITFASRTTCHVLIVAGGGGGGVSGTSGVGGGGGAGGLIHVENIVIEADTYIIHVGAGGAGLLNSVSGAGNSGESSSAFGHTAYGGGGGGGVPGPYGENAMPGGSGGGGGASGAGSAGKSAGVAVEGQGNDGGLAKSDRMCGGGGGGSRTVGQPGSKTRGGNGGDGKIIAITGNAVQYAGGGGGGTGNWVKRSSGGAGGGMGGTRDFRNGKNAVPGTGSGGGGAGSNGSSRGSSGNGGSGIVVIREISSNPPQVVSFS